MTDLLLEVYGIAHMIMDYARSRKQTVLSFADIEDFLFSMSIRLPEDKLFDTFKEMADAGWLTNIDYNGRLLYFDDHCVRHAA